MVRSSPSGGSVQRSSPRTITARLTESSRLTASKSDPPSPSSSPRLSTVSHENQVEQPVGRAIHGGDEPLGPLLVQRVYLLGGRMRFRRIFKRSRPPAPSQKPTASGPRGI